MVKVYVEGNYFIALVSGTNKIIEHNRANVKLKQSIKDDNVFTLFYSNLTEKETSDLGFSDFLDENDVPFASQDALITWFRANTGESHSPTGATDITPITDLLQGSKRVTSVVNATIDGTSTDNVQSVSFLFRGSGGTLNTVPVPDNYTASFSPNKGDDTVDSKAYTVPTGGEQRIIITYIL